MEDIPLKKSPYSRHFNFLKYIGAWTVNPRQPVRLNLYIIYKTGMTILASAGCLSLLADFYMVFGDFKKMTWNLCISTLFVGGLAKNIYTIHRNMIINRLRVNLHRDATSKHGVEDEQLEKDSQRRLRIVRMFFYTAGCIFIPAWLITRYLSYLWGPKGIPVPLRLPIKFNLEDDFQYNLVFFVVGLSGCAGIALVSETELAMFSILMQISREYDRLLNDIPKTDELYKDMEKKSDEARALSAKQEVNPWLRKIRTKVLVKEFSTRQQKLIEYTKDFELSYSRTMLLQVFVFSVLVIASAMQCILEYGNFSANLFYQMGYIVILVMDVFLFCWFATRIRGQCLRVGEEIYSTLWYYMNSDIQKDLIMIILRSQRPPKITAGKVMEMNLHAFMLLMRNIYSWLALFQQLEFKGNE